MGSKNNELYLHYETFYINNTARRPQQGSGSGKICKGKSFRRSGTRQEQDPADDILQFQPPHKAQHAEGSHQGAWKLETERGVIMDSDKPEHLLEAIPVMGSYCDVIGVRAFAKFESKEDDYNEVIINQFIKHSGKPVFSMEAATRHPLQTFADLITIEEYKKVEKPKIVMTWAPHPKALPQAVPNSFAEGINMTDYEFVITHPEGYELDPAFVGRAKVEYDQKKAFEGADFIYAKNWSAYSGDNYGKILCDDRAWTVDSEKMALTNNAYFMHCLPVRRNMIVTDDVIESPQSIVIPEAANRVVSAQTVLKQILLEL